MKRSVSTFALLSLVACSGRETEITPGPPFENVVAAEGLSGQTLVACADGTGKAGGVFFVRNLWAAKVDVRVLAEGASVSTPARAIPPGEALRVEVQVEDVFRIPVVSVLDVHGRALKVISVTPDIDDRLLEVQPEAIVRDGVPLIVIRNTMPFGTLVRLESRGSFKPEEATQSIPGRSEVEIPLVRSNERRFRPGIAALVRIEGTRCPRKAALPELPIVRVPELTAIDERPAR